ncbi:MAG: L-glutamate gamma-semialdehyde dehydrogenase [bacterium]|nr:L-glutamate gamma-semialdehyde dehydrogenase [bacterium]
MKDGTYKVPVPYNEAILNYAPKTTEREILKEQVKKMRSEEIEIPIIIGGKEIKTGDMGFCFCPHDHKHILGKYHKAGSKEIKMAIKAALDAQKMWRAMHWRDRVSVFLKAAELLAGPSRNQVNAATMLCQSKNVFQAEIDSACELIDFWRFNSYFAQMIYDEQPNSSKGIWNYVEQRPLEGFIFAVTPFNFTSIAGNLPSAPAMLGNTVVWKPASSAVYSGYYLIKLWEEAGLPPGIINFIPCSGAAMGDTVITDPNLAGVHFTGSTAVFQQMWGSIGQNIATYKSYPRIVGETGGKNFVLAHTSADREALVAALVRGAFEYQGQKCSAASRAYIPYSMWPSVKKMLVEQIKSIKMGPVEDFRNFVNAVIDQSAFNVIKGYIDWAKESADIDILIGGKCDDSNGYFIEPTLAISKTPNSRIMGEEIFGPVLTVYIYQDNKFDEVLPLVDQTSPYSLTGSVFATDRRAIVQATEALVNSSGNFYINDKPTGAVVGQQPFGGGRASGTNDKAGSKLNLMRWLSTRTIKETFNPPVNYGYPFMDAR